MQCTLPAVQRGRPRGEIRQTLLEVLTDTAALHWRAAAQAMHANAQHVAVNPASPADLRLVRKTMCNMARAGELARVGKASVPGSARPMTLFARIERQPSPGAELWAAVKGWGR